MIPNLYEWSKDADLQTKLEVVEHSTTPQEVATVGDMIRWYWLEQRMEGELL